MYKCHKFQIYRQLDCNLRRLVFDQSSPVHPVSESRGGTLNVTKSKVRRTEILVSNIGFNFFPFNIFLLL